MSLSDIGALSSAIIAAVALLLSAHQLSLSRRSQDIEGVFQLWDRYQRYAQEYAEALEGSAEEQNRSIINMLTFLENGCLILHQARAPKIMRQNITALVCDYVDMIEEKVVFLKVLDHYSSGHGRFEELRKFYEASVSKRGKLTSPPAA